MENLRNKTHQGKDYFNRFTRINVYSYTKLGDPKVHIGVKPEEVYSIFNGNTSTEKKHAGQSSDKDQSPSMITVDQSTLQYYMILALQDFHANYYLPLRNEADQLREENKQLKELVLNLKKKNDERFEVLSNNLEVLAKHINRNKST